MCSIVSILLISGLATLASCFSGARFGSRMLVSQTLRSNLQMAATPAEISPTKKGIHFPSNLNGSEVRVGIIMARWNDDIIEGLYSGVNKSLSECGVKPSNIFTTTIPGSYELPVTAKFLAASKRVDVIICLGCLIKGDTMHFEYIASAVSDGLMKVSLDSMVPVIFGVLTTLNKEQAIHRSTGDHNEGVSWGTSAVEMGLARMSAMGMKGTDGQTDTPFVLFTPQANATNEKGEQKKPVEKKKIAF